MRFEPVRSRPPAILLLAALLAVPAAAGAQTDAEAFPASGAPERYRLEARFGALAFDNFFQAPAGAPEESVDAGRVEARLSAPLDAERTLDAYGRLRYTTYGSGLDDSPGATAGLRWDRERHQADVSLDYERDRPSFDVGDEFERADTLTLAGEYGWRPVRDWQLSGLGEVQEQEFAVTRGRDNRLVAAGAAVRYRGWGYLISPEFGLTLGARDADDPNEDHDQTDYWLKLRSIPAPPVYLSLRYRHRVRDYTIGSPAASNFGREDTRRQWTLAADVETVEWLTVNLYYAFEDADSTKPSRRYETRLLGLGATVGF